MTLDELYSVASENSIPVVPFPLGDIEAMSYLSPNGTAYIGIDPDRITSKQDERLKLAHELGHAVQGAFYNKFAVCDVWKKHENRADKWAIKHLVPQEELYESVSAGFVETWELAEIFDVPPEFMARALHWYTHHNMDFTA